MERTGGSRLGNLEVMNSRLDQLHAYPFERLRVLLNGSPAPAGIKPINMGIGEPQHPTPAVITDAIKNNLDLLGVYPPTAGMPELKDAISGWLSSRYGLAKHDPARDALPVAGTREALFAFAQAVLEPAEDSVVLLPNPFYQIYEGAALLAGARPVYVPTPKENRFLPDWSAVPTEVWPKVRLVYVCSPGNPCGAILDQSDWDEIFTLADKYGFVIAADECYSEIYNHDVPIGALQAAAGRANVVAFNSLSKRSSAPGLRSGIVAGDKKIIDKFLLYRTYHGAAPSKLTQFASIGAWQDESHVVENREKYQAKFQAAQAILGDRIQIPDGSFFLWMPVEDDEAAAVHLYKHAALTVLPGSYLGRKVDGHNPGAGYLRIALVPDLDICNEALHRISQHLTI